VHGEHLLRALTAATTQRHAWLEIAGPFFPFGAPKRFSLVSVKSSSVMRSSRVSTIIAFAQRLLIEFHPNSQRNIEKVFFKVFWQAFGLRQQTARRCTGRFGSRCRTGTKQQRKCSRDGSHREHENEL